MGGKSQPGEGAATYFSEVLAEGHVGKVLDIISHQHELMSVVITLLADAEAKINIRLGIGVIMEEFAAHDWFVDFISQLGELSQHSDARVRSDACHYLSLTGNASAAPYIEALLDDNNEEVREVAKESLEELNAGA